MYRRSIVRALALAAAFTGIARFGPAGADTPSPTPIVVAMSPVTYSEIPIRYALQSGMFKAAGLDVQMQILANGSAISAGVVGGSIDVGLGTVSGVIAAAAHGLPIKLVAPAVLYDKGAPSIYLLVSTASPLKKAADFSGKTIGLSNLNDSLRPATSEWLAKNGMPPDAAATVKYAELPQSSMLDALEAGRVDAIAVISPTLDTALQSGRVRKFAPVLDAIAPRLLWTGYFARADWAANHEKALQTFLNVLAEAGTYTDRHHTTMTAELAKLLDQPGSAVEKMIWPISGRKLEPATIQPTIDLLARSNTIAKPFPASDVIFQR